MRSMLVCTDGSPASHVALEYGRALGESMKMRLKVLFVEDVRLTQGPLVTGYYGPVGMAPSPAYPAFYEDLLKTIREQGRQAIEEARKVLADSGLSVEFLTREGIVRDVILDEANSVDMLCMGRRGEHGEWERDELGSTVQKVIRHSHRPILVTPAAFRPITRLLVAYDGSKGANRALRAGLAVASEENFPIVVVTIVDEPDRRQRFDDALQDARELAGAYADVESTFELVEAEKTEDVLLEKAAEHGCDLICMGAYGESRLREWLVGSTTAVVLAHSELPVLLAR